MLHLNKGRLPTFKYSEDIGQGNGEKKAGKEHERCHHVDSHNGRNHPPCLVLRGGGG